MPEEPGRDPAYDLAIAVDRLVAEDVRLRVVQYEHDEPPLQARVSLAQESVASDEVRSLVEGDREPQAGLERRILVSQVMAPGPVPLLHAQRVHRAVPGVPQAEA